MEQCNKTKFTNDAKVFQHYLLSKILMIYKEFDDSMQSNDAFLIERSFLFVEVVIDLVQHYMDCRENNFSNCKEIYLYKWSKNGSYKPLANKKESLTPATARQIQNLRLLGKAIDELLALKQMFVEAIVDVSGEMIKTDFFNQLLQQITEEMNGITDNNFDSLSEASFLLHQLLLEIKKFINSITNLWENLNACLNNNQDVKDYLNGRECLVIDKISIEFISISFHLRFLINFSIFTFIIKS